jgi:phosphoenolpyruvate carboxykinase (ATP)
MTLPPRRYADMLGEKLRNHRSGAWLLNTGWIGGPYGVGRRIELAHSRALVESILSGAFHDVPFRPDPVFGLEIPAAAPMVPYQVLNPATLWHDRDAHRIQAEALAARFRANFAQFDGVAPEIRGAGPRT